MGGSLPPCFNSSFLPPLPTSNAHLHTAAGYELHPSSLSADYSGGFSGYVGDFDSSCPALSEFCHPSMKLHDEVCRTRSSSSSAVDDYSCKAAATESTYQRRLKLQEMKLHYCAEELGSETAADYTYHPEAAATTSCRSYSADFEVSASIDGAEIQYYPAAAVSHRRPTCSDSSDDSTVADSLRFDSDEWTTAPDDDPADSSPNRRKTYSSTTTTSSSSRRFNRYSSFPPPLPYSLPPPPELCDHPRTHHSVDACSTSLRAFRHDGRLILRQIPAPCRRYLRAHRSDGRLTLRLLTRTDSSSDGCLDFGHFLFDVETPESAGGDDRQRSADGSPTEVADSDDHTNRHLRDIDPPEPCPSTVLLSEPPGSGAALVGSKIGAAAACDHGRDHSNSHAAAAAGRSTTVEGKAGGQCRLESASGDHRAAKSKAIAATNVASKIAPADDGGDDAYGPSIYIQRQLLLQESMARAVLMRQLIHQLAVGYQKIVWDGIGSRSRVSAIEPPWLSRRRRTEACRSIVKGMDAYYYADYVMAAGGRKGEFQVEEEDGRQMDGNGCEMLVGIKWWREMVEEKGEEFEGNGGGGENIHREKEKRRWKEVMSLKALLLVMASAEAEMRSRARAAEVIGRKRCEIYEGRGVAI